MSSYGMLELLIDVACEQPITMKQARRLGKAKSRRNARSYARRSMREEINPLRTKRF